MNRDIVTMPKSGNFSFPAQIRQAVCGFVFDDTMNRVVLIRKNRPDWQAGLYNGVGGKIEPTDASGRLAMSREFSEEAGVAVDPRAWRHFMNLDAYGPITIAFYAIASTDILSRVHSVTDEEVVVENLNHLDYATTVPNLCWILPAARLACSTHGRFMWVSEAQ